MDISVSSAAASGLKVDLLIVPCFEGDKPLAGLDYGKELGAALIEGSFSGKAGESVHVKGSGIAAKSAILVGLGKEEEHTFATLRVAVCAALRDDTICKLKYTSAAIDLSVLTKGGDPKKLVTAGCDESGAKLEVARWIGQAVAEGADLGVYTYGKLFNNNEKQKEKLARPTKLTVVCDKKAADLVKLGVGDGQAVAWAVNFARDLTNDPNSHLKPKQLADAALNVAKGIKKLTAKVMEKPELEKLKMGAFLSVNAGSDDGDGAARLIVLEYKGGKKGDQPIALVGKGLTFDTGGYSLKPAASMLGMKWDMGGAACMLGAALAIAKMGLPVNLVCVVPTTENLVNEHATKPGDVVTSMAGITIEVNNTDAEGRLILCDALTYTQNTFKPAVVFDAATLTGAVLIALGDQIFGVMSNNDAVAKEIETATKDAGELSWRLPLPKEYDSYLDSDIADVSNIGGAGKAGTITAGLFLQRFIQEGVAWAHFDIAGVANNEGKQKGVAPAKGGTGTGIRTLVSFARNRCRA